MRHGRGPDGQNMGGSVAWDRQILPGSVLTQSRLIAQHGPWFPLPPGYLRSSLDWYFLILMYLLRPSSQVDQVVGHSPVLWSWGSCLTSLCLSFLLCEISLKGIHRCKVLGAKPGPARNHYEKKLCFSPQTPGGGTEHQKSAFLFRWRGLPRNRAR